MIGARGSRLKDVGTRARARDRGAARHAGLPRPARPGRQGLAARPEAAAPARLLTLGRVLVTGGAGRIATALRAGAGPSGCDCSTSRRRCRAAAGRGRSRSSRPTCARPAAMAAACEGVDAVVHLGGIPDRGAVRPTCCGSTWTGRGSSSRRPRRRGVPRVVLASSIHAAGFYPRPGAPGDELPATAPARPDSYYGWTKAAMESLGRLYADRFGMAVFALRIGAFIDRPDPAHLDSWISPADGVRLVAACSRCPGFRLPADLGSQRQPRTVVVARRGGGGRVFPAGRGLGEGLAGRDTARHDLLRPPVRASHSESRRREWAAVPGYRRQLYRDDAVVLRVQKLGEIGPDHHPADPPARPGARGGPGRAPHHVPLRRPAGAVRPRRPAARRRPERLGSSLHTVSQVEGIELYGKQLPRRLPALHGGQRDRRDRRAAHPGRARAVAAAVPAHPRRAARRSPAASTPAPWCSTRTCCAAWRWPAGRRR